MQILKMEPERRRTSGGFETIAIFDVQLSDDVRLYGVRMVKKPDGGIITWAPSSGGRRFATFSTDLAIRLAKAATEFYEGHDIAKIKSSRH